MTEGTLEKLQDVIEDLWTGKGMEVTVGENFSQLCLLDFRRNESFRDTLFGKLSDEGYFVDGKIGTLNEANLRSVKHNNETGHHEIEFQLAGATGTRYSKYIPCNFHLRIGAEFQPASSEQDRYRLKLFPKVRTEAGVMRIAAEQHPELIEQLSREFRLMYWLLQETGYVAKETPN